MRNPTSGSGTTSKTPCCSKVGLKRGPWTPEEDELLANYIKKEGEGRWRTLPKRAGLLRCGKSCRLRWMNYLRPSVKRGQIAPDEEDLILRLHRLLGNRWSLIAGRIPGRTDNEIKNYWNTHLSKKLISQGIDPRTHKPLSNSTHSSSDQDQFKASSSKANNRLPISPNPNPTEMAGIVSKNIGYFEATNLEDQYDQTASLPMRNANVQNSDNSSAMDDEIHYCTDDVFSSFLNSLINEEAMTSSQHQVLPQLQPNGNFMAPAAVVSDTLMISSSAQTFGFGTSWEGAFHQNDPKGFTDEHVEKHF